MPSSGTSCSTAMRAARSSVPSPPTVMKSDAARRTRRPSTTSKPLARKSARDPRSAIDASVLARRIDVERDDLPFDREHRHHAVPFAEDGLESCVVERLALAAQLQQELAISGRPEQRRRRKRDRHERKSPAPRRAVRASTCAVRLRDRARRRREPTRSRPASNCGLTSATTTPSARRYVTARAKIVRNEMNDVSIVDDVETFRKRVVGEAAKVDALHDAHARIVAQSPVELAVSDVDRGNAARLRAARGNR